VIRALSCGVVVTDGERVLIAHATRSPRWDIPKGVAEPGEAPEQTARRELLEETGLEAPPGLVSLGQHAYLPRKDLALFAWHVVAMPDPGTLVCRSTFLVAGRALPEFDRFACVTWVDALPRLGKSMNAVLTPIAQERRWM
jgi:8-oxo-dGTP pyrophosphatase MutT (NUDIX family)